MTTAAIHEILLIGFGAFERATLESFFRMTEQRARRVPVAGHEGQPRQRGYTCARHPTAAELVLIDGSDPAAAEHAQAWRERCVIVGGHGPLPGALGHVARPINMMTLLQLLDGLMVAGSGPRAAEAAATASAPVVASAPLPREPSRTGGAPQDEAIGPGAANPQAGEAAPAVPSIAPGPVAETAAAAAADGEPEPQILVVDDSDIALRFMARCLGRFGLGVQLAHSGEEALQRVATGRYAFVFMDVNMPGIDGYQTCRLIKKRPYAAGRKAPKVVMLTSRGGMVDKMRGTLAGCDAYLTKPLQQDDLVRAIGPGYLCGPGAAAPSRSSPIGSP